MLLTLGIHGSLKFHGHLCSMAEKILCLSFDEDHILISNPKPASSSSPPNLLMLHLVNDKGVCCNLYATEVGIVIFINMLITL